MMHPPPRPPAPCGDLAHWPLGRHWHWPAWARLAEMGDRPGRSMLLHWWPPSRDARRRRRVA